MLILYCVLLGYWAEGIGRLTKWAGLQSAVPLSSTE